MYEIVTIAGFISLAVAGHMVGNPKQRGRGEVLALISAIPIFVGLHHLL